VADQLIIPPTRPRLASRELRKMIEKFNVDRRQYPLLVIGIRGYYLDTMGQKGQNDRNLYDDAIFIESAHGTIAYNANTDPSRVRRGTGKGAQKGMASLQPGFWPAYQLGLHQGPQAKRGYLALVQRKAKVTVLRDGTPDYEDTGWFGINIHRGGLRTTSSEGCQTIHPGQWDGFIKTVEDQARRFFVEDWRQATIPYILLEEQRHKKPKDN
jgi:hypothetical protein